MTDTVISYKLDAFEGPLDLLISLIGKKKIDICDINISEILDQYLKYLDMLTDMDMEVTSEFLAMAANLIYIKSKMLLPVQDIDEQEDPRAALVLAIREYQRHKKSALYFIDLFQKGKNIQTKEPTQLVNENQEYQKKHTTDELYQAFCHVLEKNDRKLPPPVKSFDGIVNTKQISVSQKLSFILRQLVVKKVIKFFDLFKETKSRSEIVATFLAVLELTKSKKIKVNANSGDDVMLRITDDEEA